MSIMWDEAIIWILADNGRDLFKFTNENYIFIPKTNKELKEEHFLFFKSKIKMEMKQRYKNRKRTFLKIS